MKPGKLSRRVSARAQALEDAAKLARLTCPRCEGTGGDPMVGGKCAPCGGRGTVYISEPYAPCNHCEATGVEFNALGNPTTMSCVVCRGKGVIHVSGPTRECGACEGTGRDVTNEFRWPCAVCSGKGVVRVFEEQIAGSLPNWPRAPAPRKSSGAKLSGALQPLQHPWR